MFPSDSDLKALMAGDRFEEFKTGLQYEAFHKSFIKTVVKQESEDGTGNNKEKYGSHSLRKSAVFYAVAGNANKVELHKGARMSAEETLVRYIDDSDSVIEMYKSQKIRYKDIIDEWRSPYIASSKERSARFDWGRILNDFEKMYGPHASSVKAIHDTAILIKKGK